MVEIGLVPKYLRVPLEISTLVGTLVVLHIGS